ncbi:bacteriochlorophyll 4-vinyl reductase [Pontivivens ytuae]|uniref:Bacteriochlorophyll 4-vinyl reductase n=2 Tax=Pontivivens ytuae TaxID=2789856 RepID=A0A7S9LQM1_9RHOB|nr:bacteriochlorophyll 4-vinyl reductase [Pontivivens ytuae]
MLDDAGVARIGPNALIQTDLVLIERLGEVEAARIFATAGVSRDVPDGMVPETDVRQLFDALMSERPDDWQVLLTDAGTRTADYVMAHRIPRFARTTLRLLPSRLAAPLLARAITRHAWTFAGSGAFGVTRHAGTLRLTITHNPIATPGCPWHKAVFARLFRTLAGPRIRVEHETCCAEGAAASTFDIVL